MSETFHALFDAADPDRSCIVSPDGSAVSYGALGARSLGIAQGLKELGIARGDAVALWAANGPEWLAVFLACTRLGAMAVGVNARFRGREIGELLARTQARVLVADPMQGLTESREIFATIPQSDAATLRTILVTGIPVDSSWGRYEPIPLAGLGARVEPIANGCPEDPCIVFTTSGTTRAPKLVVHCQRGVVAHARDVADAFGLRADSSRILQILPFGGAFGFAEMLGAVAASCPLVVPPRFDPAEAARLARAERKIGRAHV